MPFARKAGLHFHIRDVNFADVCLGCLRRFDSRTSPSLVIFSPVSKLCMLTAPSVLSSQSSLPSPSPIPQQTINQSYAKVMTIVKVLPLPPIAKQAPALSRTVWEFLRTGKEGGGGGHNQHCLLRCTSTRKTPLLSAAQLGMEVTGHSCLNRTLQSTLASERAIESVVLRQAGARPQ